MRPGRPGSGRCRRCWRARADAEAGAQAWICIEYDPRTVLASPAAVCAAAREDPIMAAPHPSRPYASSHAANVRGLVAGANPGQPFGRFGPMFDLPPCPALPEEGLTALAKAMVKQDPG